MTRASTEQQKHTPWFAKAGAACSIVPIARFVGPQAFATKNGDYGVLFSLTGLDTESLTDEEIQAHLLTVEGTLRGLHEGFCLYEYARVMQGFDLPRQSRYASPVTEAFVSDRHIFLAETAGFRRIDLHWCLMLQAPKGNPLASAPREQASESSRRLAELLRAASILEANLSHFLGLKLLGKEQAFQFFSYLFNLEGCAEQDQLREDTGVDRQIVKSAISWESEYLRVGKRFMQAFCLKTTPEASRPDLFSELLQLDADAVLCSSWRPKSSNAARKEIEQQEKFTSFFKIGVMSRVISARDQASLETTAGAKAANLVVDDLSDAIRSLDKKAQGLYSLTLLVAARSAEQLRAVAPSVHRAFVGARTQVMEETLGNLSAFYAVFPGNARFQVFSMWLGEDHHARLSSIFAPNLGHLVSEDLGDSEYLNVFETRTGTPFFQDAYVNGVRVGLMVGPTGSGKSTLIRQFLQQVAERNESAIVYDPACEFVQRFYDPSRGDVVLNPLDTRCPYWGPAEELRRKAEAKAIAASLYQPTNDKKGEFFTETPQKVFAHLLTFGPTPQELVEWMSNPAEIDSRVKGTELEQIIAKGAQQQRAGVLASLGLIADSLRMLPTREQTGGRTWSATHWSEKREGWIFITSQATEREALRPLHSLWIDLLVLRLLTSPTDEQRPVWFVLDELASLQRLPQLSTALTENRKSKNPLVLGFQGKAQLETIYGHLAEVMLSQPATKIFLRTTEPNASKWVSETIGEVEIERMRETHQHGTRQGKSFTIDRQTEPLVMRSEVSGLADKHAFLKLGNNVARFNFAYTDLPATSAAFVPRAVEDDELTFDPLTLRPRRVAVVTTAAAEECMPEDAELLDDPEEDELIAASGTPAPTPESPSVAPAPEPQSSPSPVPEAANAPAPVVTAPDVPREPATPTTTHFAPLFEAQEDAPAATEAADDNPTSAPDVTSATPEPIPGHIAVAASEAAGYQRPAEL